MERDPPVPDRARWPEIMREAGYWTHSIEQILARHSLGTGDVRPTVPGTHAVFAVGDDLIVKLFAPYWPDDYENELRAAQLLAGRRKILVPAILAQGVQDGWPYLVTRRVHGSPLLAVWDGLTSAERHQIVRELGDVMHAIHDTPVADTGARWHEFIAAQRQGCVERHRRIGLLPESFLAEIPELLAEAGPLPAPDFTPSLLHADLTADHVFVEPRDGRWSLTGIIDFGDAVVGAPIYDLVAPGLEIAGGDADLLARLLAAAGVEQGANRQRLMAYTLLHRWVDLLDVVEWQNPDAPNSLDELAERLWPID